MTGLKPTSPPARPFLDWSVVTDPQDWKADVALLGITHSEPYAGDPRPNDQTRAPDAIRLRSSQVSDGRDHWDFDLGTNLASILPPRCIDGGNAIWGSGSYDEHLAWVASLARRLFGIGAQLFVVGGDHGVTIPVLEALDVLGTRIHVVHLDAHLDWRTEVGGVRRGYSSPLYWASQKPWISGITQIGMRGTGSARTAEVEAAREFDSHIYTAARIQVEGLEPAFDSIPAASPVYVTIDADGFDPTEMPAVMAPVPGGLRFAQVAPFLRALAQRQRIVGMDVVEIAPFYDSSTGISCITAGRLIVNVLGASWAPDGALGRGARRVEACAPANRS